MKTNNEDLIQTAVGLAIDAVAAGSGVSAQTVKNEIETAVDAALKSGNPRLFSLQKAKGAPPAAEDAVLLALLRFALLAADDGQN